MVKKKTIIKETKEGIEINNLKFTGFVCVNKSLMIKPWNPDNSKCRITRFDIIWLSLAFAIYGCLFISMFCFLSILQ